LRFTIPRISDHYLLHNQVVLSPAVDLEADVVARTPVKYSAARLPDNIFVL
jgi:hypothetical protein